MRHSQWVHDKSDRNWFDALGWGVGLVVAAELSSDAEVNLVVGVFPWVFGPQTGVLLCHRSCGVFHRSRLDLSLAGGNASVPVTLPEHLEDGNWITVLMEERVNLELVTEFEPSVPMAIVFVGSFSGDSSSCRCLHKLEVSAEFILLVTRHCVQCASCGNRRENKVSDSESERCQA